METSGVCEGKAVECSGKMERRDEMQSERGRKRTFENRWVVKGRHVRRRTGDDNESEETWKNPEDRR